MRVVCKMGDLVARVRRFDKLSDRNCETERSDARGLGSTLPSAPPGLSRSDWGLEIKNARSAKRRKGFGEYAPQCPTGAVT